MSGNAHGLARCRYLKVVSRNRCYIKLQKLIVNSAAQHYSSENGSNWSGIHKYHIPTKPMMRLPFIISPFPRYRLGFININHSTKFARIQPILPTGRFPLFCPLLFSKIIAINLLQFIYLLSGTAEVIIDHQLRQLFAIDKDNFNLIFRRIAKCISGKVRRSYY